MICHVTVFNRWKLNIKRVWKVMYLLEKVPYIFKFGKPTSGLTMWGHHSFTKDINLQGSILHWSHCLATASTIMFLLLSEKIF